MEYILFFITLGAAIIDTTIFFQPIHNYWGATCIHVFLFVLIFIFNKQFNIKNKDLPIYYFLFMPGLGGILISALYFSLIYFEKNTVVLDEYEKYINYENTLKPRENFNYEQEIRTMSFLDYMNLLDEASKKNLIIDLAMNKYDMKVNVLQRGLQDKDSEVQHYAATTINMIENDYTNLIYKVREEFNLNKDIDSLLKLRDVYKNYLESGLLSGEVFRLYNKEFSEVLVKLLERKKGTPEIINDLVKSYIESNDIDRAEALNAKLLNYPERPEGVINQIRIAYNKNIYKDIVLHVKELKNNEVFEKFQPQLSFWSRTGE